MIEVEWKGLSEAEIGEILDRVVPYDSAPHDSMEEVTRIELIEAVEKALREKNANPAKVREVATVRAADEYGPIVHWTEHWDRLIGKKLYVESI